MTAAVHSGRRFCETGTTDNSMLTANLGGLEVKIASSTKEITACQNLRFKVFYEELGAKSVATACAEGLDTDGYDHLCDHLMVLDGGNVVGTYRLLRQDKVDSRLGFYTQGEFDIAPMLHVNASSRFLELGRSCVLRPWRTKRVVELLWQGIWNYVRLHRLDVMFGCASLSGTDANSLSIPLSYLHHHHLATGKWAARAHEDCFVEMNMCPVDSLNPRSAFKSLPPLIKGYLRLGAQVGYGAAADRQFNTTDVLITLPIEQIDPRYFNRFGAPNRRD